MSAKQRQMQIIQDLIKSSPVLLRIDNIQHVGDERPDNHLYSIKCRCGGWVHIMLEQDKDADWTKVADDKHEQHIVRAHNDNSSVV
jgi:hypothetical protein